MDKKKSKKTVSSKKKSAVAKSKKSIQQSKNKVLKAIKLSEEIVSDSKLSSEKIEDSKTAEKSKELDKKNDTEKKRGLPFRIGKQFLKTIFYRIPVFIVVLVLVVLLGLKIYLSPSRVQNLIISNFNNMSNGEITLNVNEFSPYGGFVMENILIRNGEEFGKTKFVEIEKLAVKYGLFSMLIGNVEIEEIGIYKPRIYLTEKKGVWNAAKLMKPGEKKEEKVEKKKEEKKEEKVASADTSSEINLPISVRFLFKFILDDLRVYVNGSKFNSKLEGLTFNIDIDVPPFKKIPKSVEAVSLLKTMNIVLNPKEMMKVSYFSKEADATPPLILTWRLNFENQENSAPQFNSSFKFGTYRAPARFKKSFLTPLNFMVSYDLFYNPISDNLTLNHFGVKFKNKKWLNLTGKIGKVTKKQIINIKMQKSEIVLNDLYPYFKSFTGDRKTKFRGVISLYPLTIKGTPKNMDVHGEINIRRLYFKNPDVAANMPGFKFKYDVLMRNTNMKIGLNLAIPHLWYTLDGSRSGDNGIRLITKISAYRNFGRVKIDKFSFQAYNPVERANVLDVSILGDIKLKPVVDGNIRINKFRFLNGPLGSMLTGRLRKQLASLPFKKPVDMDLKTKFYLSKKKTKADLAILFKIPDFNMNDLVLNAKILQDNKKKKLSLKKFHFGSKSWNLSIDSSGIVELKKAPVSNMDLKLIVKFDNPKLKTIQGPWKLSGLFQLNTFIKGDLKTGKAYGSMVIDKFFVKNDKSQTYVNNVNMNFPFEYKFMQNYKGQSMISVEKKNLINNDNFSRKPNFTIDSIKIKHPARDLLIAPLKDFAMVMFFEKNMFMIESMKAYIFDGSLYGKNILFYLADMDVNNFEYNILLNITNVDIGKLDKQDSKSKKRDAELSLNVNFAGRGLDVAKELDVKGYINIYKIGSKFAKKLMEGLSETEGESKLGFAQKIVDNSMSIKGFNFNIEKGLVYTTVSLDKGIVGQMVGIEHDKIEFDRITIQEYLKNITGE